MARPLKDFQLDLSDPDACYLLGAILGDGTVTDYLVRVCVGENAISYARAVLEKMLAVGWSDAQIVPGRGPGTVDVRVCSKKLASEIRRYKTRKPAGWVKTEGRCNPWAKLEEVQHVPHFLAGLFDTDGHLASKSANVVQRSAQNMSLVRPLFESVFGPLTMTTYKDRTVVYITGRSNLRKLAGLPLLHPAKKMVAETYLKIGRRGEWRSACPDYVAPVNALLLVEEHGSLRAASRETGHSRHMLAKKIRSLPSEPVYRENGKQHLIVDASKTLHGLISSMVAACKNESGRVDEFLQSAIRSELKNWE